MRATSLLAPAAVPIGQPLAGTRCYVLDRALCPVPPGAVGELYLAGPQLARGYVARPELTAARFVADPFGRPGRRMYRTGDRVRWRAGHGLEFVGRADHQVKIRGFRVEPAEAEAVLAADPRVGQVAVVARPDQSGSPQLVAYLVLNPGADLGELRRDTVGRLPDYLVPSAFVALDRLPLTRNGKLDHRALPEPQQRPDPVRRAPRNAREAALCTLFAEVLGRSEVGIDDNFFDLGGHSLQATRLVGRIRARLEVDFPLRLLLGRHTVADIAAAIDETPHSGASAGTDFLAEAELDPAITGHGRLTVPPEAIVRPQRVLLTGATGFLGSFLLRELLDQGTPQVYCLVRAATEPEALERLRRTMIRYQLWDETLAARIVPLCGDLEQPLLGLDQARFTELSETVDVLFHNGAKVNVVDPYSRLSAANVQGTREVLRLATTHRVKPVHYVSTVGVAISRGHNPPVLFEDRRVSPDAVPPGGYVGAKWVAEELVHAAGQRGVPVAVYRPGRIGGHTRTGVCAAEDALWTAARAMVELGCAPELGPPVEVDLAPVDYVAGAIARLARRPDSLGRVFHLTNPEPASLAGIIGQLRRFGYPLSGLSQEDWQARLAAVAERRAAAGDHGLDPAVLLAAGLFGGADPVRFDHTNTRRGLAGSAIGCPAVDGAMVAGCLRYLVGTGAFPEPPASTEGKSTVDPGMGGVL